ncbi:SWIM zinc finger family protein [Actinoplanes subglobosus]|uniref:SWIM zinc finger domain-containing protein n=1 Tax=Actinoplanes subglobosus TaxID=1547892 RepID=A0ABV8ITR0_9ACTN
MTWFTDADLRRLAGPKSYERGVAYVDAVGVVDELPDGVVATVEGSESYVVRLSGKRSLRGECTCPWGDDGNFCKHCVAVGLSLLAAQPVRRRRPASPPDLRTYLESVDRAALVDLVVELASDDPALSRRLSLRAATHGKPDVKELRRLVGGLRARGFLPYGRGFDYARKASEVLDALDSVAASHPADAGPLYLTAIQNITRTLEQADDSSGSIGDTLRRAVSGYAVACRAAPPDPMKLAAWMIDIQVTGPGWPDIPIADFADALGPDGLKAYRDRLAAADPGGWAVRHLREQYLKVIAKDTDALVALYAEELPQSYRYVQIGTTLRSAGRPAEAINWLRRGRTEADRPDGRIDELLAELLTETGAHTEAADLRWHMFIRQPGPQSHRALLDAAERTGTLPETAERADSHLRELARAGGYAADPLVEILRTSGDIDGAWAAAVEHRCGPGLFWQLTVARAETHPAEAIPGFERQTEAAVDQKNKKGYAEAARLLTELRSLHERAGSSAFPAYLAAVRQTHRNKPTLMATLTKAGL